MSPRLRAHLVLNLLAAGCLLAGRGAAGEEASLIQCEADFAAAPEVESSSECFYRFGWAGTGPREEAMRHLEALIAADPDNAWLAFYLGNLHADVHGHGLIAEKWYRQAAARFAATGERRGEARTHLNLARVLRADPDKAAAEMKRVFAIAGRSGDPTLIAMRQVEEASELIGDARYDRAQSLLEQAHDPIFADGWYGLKKRWLVVFSVFALELDRNDEAAAFSRQYDELTMREGDHFAEANAKYNRICVLAKQAAGQMDEDRRATIQELADGALAAAAAGNNSRVEAEIHQVLGTMAGGEEAKAHLVRCSEATDFPALQAYCLSNLARHLAAEAPSQARELLERARELVADDPWTLADVLANQMRVSWEIDPPDQAEVAARQALAAIEKLRSRQSDQTVAALIFSSWADNYYWLAGHLLEQGRAGDLERAFAVIERMRARSLREALAAAGVPPDVRAAGGQGVSTLAEAQDGLAENEALLSFLVAPDLDPTGEFGGGSWLLATTRAHGTRAYRLPQDRAGLSGSVKLFNGSLKSRDGTEGELGAGLYETLLGPALAELPRGVDRLILVPDDALHLLPFGALRRAPDAEPLAVRYLLSQVPSATLWLDWRNRPRPEAAQIPALALADPPLGRGSAPGFRGATLRPTDRRGIRTLPLYLPPLPYARREAQAVRRALGLGTVLREGAQASENFLKHEPDLSRYGILHFATHSYTDDQYPERSAVLLARASGEDGWLVSGEITHLKLAGRVVVLASCRSASGRPLRGEGLVSLASAFFQAGAPTVVASLRPLLDDDAEKLFSRFYDHLAEGESVAAALRAAQRDRIDEGAPAAAWADVVVLGDGDVVPVPGGRPWPARHAAEMITAAGALVFFGILVALARGPRPAPRP